MIGAERATAYAPGRVNLMGDPTGVGGGLALAFSVSIGVAVTAVCGTTVTGGAAAPLTEAAFAELRRGGVLVPSAELTIRSDLPAEAGLGSAAAQGVATVMALAALAGAPPLSALKLAQACQRITQSTGISSDLVDALAVILGRPGQATLIDFASLNTRQVPLELGGAQLVLLPAWEEPAIQAVDDTDVLAFVDAMGDPVALGRLLGTRTVAGAYGARLADDGRSVLALFPAGAALPAGASGVGPGAGAHLR